MIENLCIGKSLNFPQANAVNVKKYALSVMKDEKIKHNLANIQKLIEKAPGNKGGAQLITEYFSNI